MKANVLFFDRRAGSAQAATRKLWVYDLRTNKHFTLKTKPLQRADLDEFVSLYKPGAIDQRQPTWREDNPEGRWRSYELDDLQSRDKTSLDLFWLKDESLLDSDNLPDPDVIAAEITGGPSWGPTPSRAPLPSLKPPTDTEVELTFKQPRRRDQSHHCCCKPPSARWRMMVAT